MSEDDSVEVSDKKDHELVKNLAITKVKSKQRNREVEIVLSETHLSWKSSNKFQNLSLDHIDMIDLIKGKKGFLSDILLSDTPAELIIMKKDGVPYLPIIRFDPNQNDELEQFIKLFKLTKKRIENKRIKSIKERHDEVMKNEAVERERTKDYVGAVKRWEKLGAYDEVRRVRKFVARERESARDYDPAIKIWEELGEIEEAARVRKLKAEEGSVKVSQKVVHGDNITKTEIKDSVLNRSNVGGGSSKMQELKELTEMKEKGLIDDDEFKQMKKEILGK